MASRLTSLPPELRNEIYSHLLFSSSLTLVIKISPAGKVIIPTLALASRALHTEITSYFSTALSHPTTTFPAKILDYDPHPLVTALKLIAQRTGFSLENLVRRCTVEFLSSDDGIVNVDNAVRWVEGSISQPSSFPIFQFGKGNVEGLDGGSLFEGVGSLKKVLEMYREFERRGRVEEWDEVGAQFLWNLWAHGVEMGTMGKGVTEIDTKMMDVKEVVVRNYVEWHDRFLERRGRCTEEDCRFVVQTMVWFEANLEANLEAEMARLAALMRIASRRRGVSAWK